MDEFARMMSMEGVRPFNTRKENLAVLSNSRRQSLTNP